MDRAVDELIRYVTPVMSFIRTVTHDHTYRGTDLVEGDRSVAHTIRCLYPDGTRVVCMTIAELDDGLIARQTIVQAWDE